MGIYHTSIDDYIRPLYWIGEAFLFFFLTESDKNSISLSDILIDCLNKNSVTESHATSRLLDSPSHHLAFISSGFKLVEELWKILYGA